MLKAGALYYAIIVSLLIALVTGSMILLAYNHQFQINQIALKNRIDNDLLSGITLLSSGSNTAAGDDFQEVSLYNDNNHIIQMRQGFWGLYKKNIAKAERKDKTYYRVALSGTAKKDDGIALYLTENNKPLSLCGKTVIKGAAYVPKSGVKRAYIEGQNYIGRQLVYGKTYYSEKSLPGINTSIIQYHELTLQQGVANATVTPFENFEQVDTINQSFFEEALVLSPEGYLTIDQSIVGNVIIHSNYPVMLKNYISMEDVIIYAPSVNIANGFKGSLQVFAADSIVIGDKVELRYPSSLCLLQSKSTASRPRIVIADEAKIHGTVFVSSGNTRQNGAQLEIGKDTEVSGEVYVNGQVSLKGSVYGSLYADGFYLKTRSSVYTNTLLNATIDFTKLSEYQMGSYLMADTENSKDVVKWLF